MPEVAKIIDWVTEGMGFVPKVLWAKEGGIEVGTPLDRSKLVTPCFEVEEKVDPFKPKPKRKTRRA